MRLFVPLAYAVAAQVEALDVREFLQNPTKLAKGLQALHQIVAVDAIICACAGGMEAEALGAALTWDSYPPKVVSHPAHHEALTENFESVITGSARLSAALEATRRLAATVQGEPALAVVMTGPVTFTEQLSGLDFSHIPSEKEANAVAMLEYAGKFLLELNRQFLLAGANLIVLLEDYLPQPVLSGSWYSVVTPVVNVARFHKALTAVLPLQAATESIPPFIEHLPKGSVLCLPGRCITPEIARRPIGIALPNDPISWDLLEGSFPLLTTSGEVPPTTDIGAFRAACERLRGWIA